MGTKKKNVHVLVIDHDNTLFMAYRAKEKITHFITNVPCQGSLSAMLIRMMGSL